MIPFIQEVAADDEIKFTQTAVFIFPTRQHEGDVFFFIEPCILKKKILGLRMIICGSNVCKTMVQQQAGQANSTPHLQDPCSHNLKIKDKMGKDQT